MARAVQRLGIRACLARSTMDSGEGLPKLWVAETTDSCLQVRDLSWLFHVCNIPWSLLGLHFVCQSVRILVKDWMDTLHHLAGMMMMFCSKNPFMKSELRISGFAYLLACGGIWMCRFRKIYLNSIMEVLEVVSESGMDFAKFWMLQTLCCSELKLQLISIKLVSTWWLSSTPTSTGHVDHNCVFFRLQ